MTITHDALNLTVQGSPLPALALAYPLHRDPTHPLVAKRVISCCYCEWHRQILRVGGRQNTILLKFPKKLHEILVRGRRHAAGYPLS